MKNAQGLAFLALLAIPLLLTTACTYESETCVEDECYEVCDVYCDYWSCEEYCELECYCTSTTTYYAECYSNNDCYRNEVCISGTCVSEATGSSGLCEPCDDHSDCYENDALCVTLSNAQQEQMCGRSCTTDRDCPNSFVCVELLDAPGSQCIPEANTCSDVSYECSADTDCRQGERCMNRECVYTDTSCTEDSECDEGYSCFEGECTHTLECNENSDCAQGESCVEGECVVAGECSADAQCPLGLVCSQGECSFQSCEVTADCTAGLCVEGLCHPTCSTNTQCASGQICVDGVCMTDSRIQCRFSSDCENGEICVNATCEQECDSNSDCEAGYICRVSYCDEDPAVECRASSECEEGESCVEGACVSAS